MAEADCKAIQEMLCLETDANFGKMTRDRIALWQRFNGNANPDGNLKSQAEVDRTKQLGAETCPDNT